MSKHSKTRVFLSDSDKASIRRSKLTAQQLAADYNVATNTIYAIIRSKSIKSEPKKDECDSQLKFAESRGILIGYNKAMLGKEQIVKDTFTAIMVKFGTVRLDEVKIGELNEFQQELIDKLKVK
jgi:hypothetical protein